MAEVVAIVLNFRLADATLRVVDQLARCGHATTVIVIENGSGDDSVNKLRAGLAGLSRCELMVFAENLGYCGAINRGLTRARELGAEHVLLLNNDVQLSDGFLAPLVGCLVNDPTLAGVAPTIVTPDGKVWSEGGDVRARPNLVALRNQGREPSPTTSGPQAVAFLTGACVLYRLADLAAIGDLDEAYFMYWEDVDLGARLRARGRKLLWWPWVRIVHEASSSSGGGRSPLRKYMSAVNTVRWLRDHGRATEWAAFCVFDVLLLPLTFLSGTRARAAWAKLRGTWDGFRGHRVTRADVERYLGTARIGPEP
ncbi:MAG: glycosyltransferase family 2 protein [Planctomycetes bacterium]|nr:glycosyltransferase family 2 protein [Planctomycetota bacterium]